MVASHSQEVSQTRKFKSQIEGGNLSGLQVSLIQISHLSSYQHDQSTEKATEENGKSKLNQQSGQAVNIHHWKGNTCPFVGTY